MYIPIVAPSASVIDPVPIVSTRAPTPAPTPKATPLPKEAEQPAAPPDKAPEPRPRKPFSRLAALCLVLGMLSLGAVGATPFLEPGELLATEDMAKEIGSRHIEGIREDVKPYVIGIPAGVASLVLLSLVIGLASGRFGLPSLFLVYLSGLLAAGLLFLALFAFRQEWGAFQGIQSRVEALRAQGSTGGLEPQLGPFVLAGLGGAVGASAFLILAAVFMHRRFWSRSLGFLFLGGITALGAVWIFRDSLNIGPGNPYLPF
jgi:hypothetical protein